MQEASLADRTAASLATFLPLPRTLRIPKRMISLMAHLVETGLRPLHRFRLGTTLPALAVAAALLPSSLTVGASIPIVNPGFEDISVGQLFNEFSFGAPLGWSLHDPLGVAGSGAGPVYYVGTLTPFEIDPVGNPGVYVNFPAGAYEGERVAIAFNFAGSGGQGEYGLVQTLSAALEPATTYTLTVAVGNIASGTAMSGDFFNLDGFPGYRVDLLAGDVVVAQDDNTLAGSIREGEFALSTITLTTSAAHPQLGEPLSIRVVNLNVVDPMFPGADVEVDFDAVTLDATPVGPSADLNGDGVVDGADLGLMLGAWSTRGADLNGDGTTDGADLGVLLAAWS